MTGGVVVILGGVGRNSGGGHVGRTLYSTTPRTTLHNHLSAGVYEIDPLEYPDEDVLHPLLERYAAETASVVATDILTNWRRERIELHPYRDVGVSANTRRDANG